MTVPQLKWVLLESSNVEAVAWQAENLYVHFKSGGIYEYSNVPKSVFDALCSSVSPGAFVRNDIVDRYQYRKIT